MDSRMARGGRALRSSCAIAHSRSFLLFRESCSAQPLSSHQLAKLYTRHYSVVSLAALHVLMSHRQAIQSSCALALGGDLPLIAPPLPLLLTIYLLGLGRARSCDFQLLRVWYCASRLLQPALVDSAGCRFCRWAHRGGGFVFDQGKGDSVFQRKAPDYRRDLETRF